MENLLLNAWSTVGSIVLAILILLVMVTIHEFGHYIVGKILGFRIDEFSVGFGPALFKRRSKKTGELFALRLIPLGGYCAFAGEDGLDDERDKPQENGAKPPLSEPFADMLPEDEQPSAAPSAPSDAEGAAREKNDVQENGATQGNAAAQAGSAREAVQETPIRKGKEFTKMAPWKRIIVLVAGAFMNYVLAVFLLIVCFFAYGQTMVAVYRAEPTAEIAEAYCLHDYDILLEAEGRKLYLTTDIAQALNGKREGDRAEFLVSRVVGTDTDGVYLREEMTVQIVLRADVDVRNSADLDGVWRALGIAYETEGESGTWMLANASYRFGFWETLGRSFAYSFKIAGSIFKVIGELLTGKLGISALGGPVTTITMTSQIAGRSFRGFLEIAGFLGVNLAVFNLLPIPALDGSKVIFTVIECIRGKPISRKVEAVIHAVGFVLLLGFAVLVDILQFI